MFFDLLLYDVGSGKSKSLNQLIIEAKSEHGIELSKQGLDKKFNDDALHFLKRLIEKQLAAKLNHQLETQWLKKFTRVTLKDGTRFDILDKFKDMLPGSGGSASKAGACIQFEFDLKTGTIIELDITPANRPDNKEASEVLDDVAEGDLVIRDLGYHIYASFLNIIKKKAFFISRLHPKTPVYILKNGFYQRLDFKKLYHKMKSNGEGWKCISVFIGADKMPVNMTMEIVPEAVHERRIRNAKKNNSKKGRKTSEEYNYLTRFSLFITNIPKKDLPPRIISTLYRIRWQIELIFKIWKSIFCINHKTSMKFKRWLCLLYVRLLIMIINWNIIMNRRNYLYRCSGDILSLNKCFKTLFENSDRLRKALKKGMSEVRKLLSWADKILDKNHWLEEKKNSKSFKKILSLKICKSNEYTYI